jgi:hypothetical protein
MEGVKQKIKDLLHREKSKVDKSEYEPLIDNPPDYESPMGKEPLTDNKPVTNSQPKVVRPIPSLPDIPNAKAECISYNQHAECWVYVENPRETPILWRESVSLKSDLDFKAAWASWSTIAEVRKKQYQMLPFPKEFEPDMFDLYLDEQGEYAMRPKKIYIYPRSKLLIEAYRMKGFIVKRCDE